MWRKRNKYLLRMLSLLPLCALLCFGCGMQDNSRAEIKTEYTRGVFAMGTYMTFTAYGESAEAALELSEDKVKELEALWSITDESSDIYRVNHNGGVPTEISGETAEVLAFALDMAAQTDGALELTISPVVMAWGFISRDYRIPDGEELAGLLQYVDYKEVTLEENTYSGDKPSGRSNPKALQMPTCLPTNGVTNGLVPGCST